MKNSHLVTAASKPGVFTEAIALGKIVVISEGTHGASELRRLGAGRTFDFHRREALAAAIGGLLEQRDEEIARAAEAARDYSVTHTPARFVDAILAAASAP